MGSRNTLEQGSNVGDNYINNGNREYTYVYRSSSSDIEELVASLNTDPLIF